MPMMTRLMAAALLAASVSSSAMAQNYDYRQQAETLCMNDVMTLCSAYVPDEGQIKACMQARRAQLSPPCRKVFLAGMRQQRQQRRQQAE